MKISVKTVCVWLKYPVAFALLGLLLSQLDVQALWQSAKDLSLIWVVAALVCFTISQIIAVLRMNAYYRWHDKQLDFWYSLKLHYVALFYNIVLPGGIGGDGYKVWLLKKQAAWPAKQGIQIQLLTRTNGLLVLALTIMLTLPFVFPAEVNPLTLAALILCSVLGGGIYMVVLLPILRANRRNEWRALPYSVGVQGFSILTMLCLWVGLNATGDAASYILLFQSAAIAGMIPITIGGLGLREFTFYYGAGIINALTQHGDVDPETGVLVSLLMFAITLVSALVGLVWLHTITRAHPNNTNMAVDKR
ncbi:MAG: hypothetical protein CMM93_07495 [Rickettsiales bacterium]|nr:hypothetical protein [Rickettsiales bacterium]